MADLNINGLFMNYLLSALYRKVIVPNDFHTQSIAILEIMRNDVTGLVQSLTDFQVHSATVDYSIRTKNDNLNDTLKEWLNTINSDYKGRIPSGIKPLAEEYFKERWKGASFPILKIIDWKEIDGIMLPSKMAFVAGGSVYAKRISIDQNYVDLLGYEYYLGRKRDPEALLGDNCILTKPFGRWYDEYPIPYLIKNGVYYNFKLIQMLKDKQAQILDQILPYLLTIKKNTDELAIKNKLMYDDSKLQKVADQIEEVIQRMNDFQFDGQRKSKTPLRVTQHDEKIEHLIPDLLVILKKELFDVLDKNILSSLGFIDIGEAFAANRRESIINPKIFMEETQAGVTDFKQILKELIFLIKDKNKDKVKTMNDAGNWHIMSSPIQNFMTDKFKDQMIQLYSRGVISKKTVDEIVGRCSYEYEVMQRSKEAERGDEYLMFPPVVQNVEQMGVEGYPYNPPAKTGTAAGKNQASDIDERTTNDKIDPVSRQNYNKASIIIPDLEGSPYKNIGSLPDAVKEKIKTVKGRRQWMSTWNGAYHWALGKWNDKAKAETMAFKTAWAKTPH